MGRRMIVECNTGVQVFQPNERRGNVPQKSRDRYHEVGQVDILLELLSDAIMYMSPTFTAEIAPKWITTAPTRNAIFRAFSALDLSILGWPLLDTITLHAYVTRLVKLYIVFHLNEHPAAP